MICDVAYYVGLAVCGQVTGRLLSGENVAEEIGINRFWTLDMKEER